METEIEIKTEPASTEETQPDVKKMLAEKVIMMAQKLGVKPETLAMMKKDCGLSDEKADTESKPATEEKPKADGDLMEMLKQMSNR